MKRAALLLLGLLATVPAWAAELTVSAASSLTESFRELGTAYEKAHPGTRVDFNFAASGVLLQQISRGAPVDVFASADETTMDQAQRQDLLAAGSREVFAVNALWVVVPPQAKAAPRTLKDLAGAGVQRVALGNPDSVPVGRYAKSALEAAGLWPSVQGKTITTQNGSSSSSACGCVTRARARAVRWRWPPDTCDGSRSPTVSMRNACNHCSTASMRRLRNGLNQPRSSPNATFWRTLRCGNNA